MDVDVAAELNGQGAAHCLISAHLLSYCGLKQIYLIRWLAVVYQGTDVLVIIGTGTSRPNNTCSTLQTETENLFISDEMLLLTVYRTLDQPACGPDLSNFENEKEETNNYCECWAAQLDDTTIIRDISPAEIPVRRCRDECEFNWDNKRIQVLSFCLSCYFCKKKMYLYISSKRLSLKTNPACLLLFSFSWKITNWTHSKRHFLLLSSPDFFLWDSREIQWKTLKAQLFGSKVFVPDTSSKIELPP